MMEQQQKPRRLPYGRQNWEDVRLSSVLLLLILAACTGRQNPPTRLSQASALVDTAPDRCLAMLDSIDASAYNEDEHALLTLLRAQASWKLYRPGPSDSLMATVVDHYRNNSQQPQLCTAIYYRAMPLYEQGQHQRATGMLLEGERMAEQLADDSLRSKYYESLYMVYNDARAFTLALSYAKKFLQHAIFIDKVEYIARGFSHVSTTYVHLGMPDSAMAYIEKTKPLLASIPATDRAYILTNIALKYLRRKDYATAKQLLTESLQQDTLDNTLLALSTVYAVEGDIASAHDCYDKCMQIADSTIRLAGMKMKLRGDIAHGLNEEALSLLEDIDRYETQLKLGEEKQVMAEAYAKFGSDVLRNRYNTMLLRGLACIALCAVVIGILALITRHSRRRYEQDYLSHLRQLDHYEKEHAILAQEKKDSVQVMEKLQQRVREMDGTFNDRILKGKVLYEQLKDGKKLQADDNDSMKCLIDYFFVSHYETYILWEKTYSKLTTRQLFFLILQDMGYADDRIAELLSVSPGAVRTMKSRMKKAEK